MEKLCCQCSKEFTPSRETQEHCLTPCRARSCPNCSYRRVGEHVETYALGSREQKYAQMDELFRGYESLEPIVIPRLPDGAKVLILSDIQIPFEERWLIAGTVGKAGAVEQFISKFRPDIIIYNGDILDCYTISQFQKSPNRLWTLEHEQQLAKRMLDEHRKRAPQARLIYVDGNHEARLWKTLVAVAQSDPRARELLGVLNITSLTTKHILGLEERGIEWLPYGSYVDILGFIITHGDLVSAYSAYTAKRMSDRYRSSGSSGHTHRLGAYYYTTAGQSHVWMESGSLCRSDPEYCQNPNWQAGFIYGKVHNNKLHACLVNAFNKTFYANGEFF